MTTLESTKQAFDKWRAAKINVNTPAPVELWDMVKELLLNHKKSEICRMLRISGHQIQSHCTTASPTQSQALQPPRVVNNFVEATPSLTVGMAELTLKGDSKTLHLCLPTSALRDILPILGALL